MKTVLIVCGALAREVLAIKEKHGWDADVWGVPALLHNRPDQIPPAVRLRIREARVMYDRVVVVYGDCGTGGMLDRLLAEEGVERLAGPHCYEMYANGKAGVFEQMMDDQLGTFFLTDYLAGSFDHLVIEELGLDRHPQLRDDYFAHYTRVIYLVQQDDSELRAKAQWAADYLQLPLEIHRTGYGALETRLVEKMAWENTNGNVSDRVLA
ncbi:MAG: DUF1638 domain-containing protein [Chloroflexi bacterium]|nr:DUF1638 domain-containing protein [Chloroflexota bacterium]